MADKLPDISPTPIQLVYYQQEMGIFPITEEQLDKLAALESGESIGWFTFVAGICETLVVTLTTVDHMSDRTYSTYVAATVATLLLSIFFGIKAVRERLAGKEQVNSIKRNSRRIPASGRASHIAITPINDEPSNQGD